MKKKLLLFALTFKVYSIIYIPPAAPRKYLVDTLLNYVACGQLSQAKILLQLNKIDIDITDGIGTSSLHVAAGNCRNGTLKHLVDIGANINARNRNGEAPLHWCCFLDNHRAAKILLDAGAQHWPLDHCGRSPLHFAAKYNAIKVVELLLESGANPDRKDDSNNTPLKIAKHKGFEEIVALLESAQTFLT